MKQDSDGWMEILMILMFVEMDSSFLSLSILSFCLGYYNNILLLFPVSKKHVSCISFLDFSLSHLPSISLSLPFSLALFLSP